MSAGVLTAEFEGPYVKFTMTYPDGFDHCFMVEKRHVDPEGKEIWLPIHTGTDKFVHSEVDYELATGEDMRVRGGTYRALAYRDAEPDAAVNIIHTDGTYTDSVTV